MEMVISISVVVVSLAGYVVVVVTGADDKTHDNAQLFPLMTRCCSLSLLEEYLFPFYHKKGSRE